MSTLQDFENAPVGTLARKGKDVYCLTCDPGDCPWVRVDGREDIGWVSPADLHQEGFTLVPPAPSTVQEALDLAWELAHPVIGGQKIPAGTKYLYRHPKVRFITELAIMGGVEADDLDVCSMRTFDPVLPDWLDAPAVLASHPLCADTEQIGIWIPSNEEGNWEWPLQQGEFMAHWSELEDVTPLYPKEDA